MFRIPALLPIVRVPTPPRVNAPEFVPVANVMYFTPAVAIAMSIVNRVVARPPKVASAPVVGTPVDQFPGVFQSLLVAPFQLVDPASTRSLRKHMNASCIAKNKDAAKSRSGHAHARRLIAKRRVEEKWQFTAS